MASGWGEVAGANAGGFGLCCAPIPMLLAASFLQVSPTPRTSLAEIQVVGYGDAAGHDFGAAGERGLREAGVCCSARSSAWLAASAPSDHLRAKSRFDNTNQHHLRHLHCHYLHDPSILQPFLYPPTPPTSNIHSRDSSGNPAHISPSHLNYTSPTTPASHVHSQKLIAAGRPEHSQNSTLQSWLPTQNDN